MTVFIELLPSSAGTVWCEKPAAISCDELSWKRSLFTPEVLVNCVARGCSGDLHYDRPRNLPSNPPELLCICIVRVYAESYVDSQNSLFCLLTCNNDHKSLYMPILWYVIISPNSIQKSFEVHNSCLNHKNLALKFREIVVVEKAVDV